MNNIGRVELVNMEFFSNHGCFEEERIIGNKFIVNCWVDYDCSKAAQSDDINDALNYQELYDIIKAEMAKPSHLLENVAGRIIAGINRRFISYIIDAQVTIDKINPPLGGKVGASRVTLKMK
ncbi:MAG: dihydroneopterin aldolase [Bacteroidales bacterium]|nr:dihydroneopterin aldolase [Bacteroidales bacterium]